MQNVKVPPSHRVLMIEDNYDDFEILSHQLDSAEHKISLEHCDCLTAAFKRLESGEVDLILLDLSLPDSRGIETFTRLHGHVPNIPVVVLTGTDDDELAIQALRRGAQEYLIKGRIDADSLYRCIDYALARSQAVSASAKLAAIVECSDDAIVGKTLNGTITSWNRGAEQTFGYSAAEATGRSVSMLIPKEASGELEGILANLRNGKGIHNEETVRVKKDGQRIDVLSTISPIKTPDGTITGGAAISRDITERKRADQNLKETEQRLSLALKAAAVGVWDLDLVSGTVWRSLRHDEIFGHDSLLPEWSVDIFLTYALPEDHAYVKKTIELGISSGQYSMECRIVRADGKIRWIFAQGDTFKNEHGTPVRMMGTVVDITDRKEQEEQQRLLAVLQEREDFMATLTHDMQNPLIGGNRLLEMLVAGRVGALNAEQTNLIETLIRSNTGVLNLIRNLIEIYQLEKSPGSIELAKTNLTALMTSLASRMDPIGKLRGITIAKELPENVQIMADSDALERVVQNLLDNALKFSPADSVVTLRLIDGSDSVSIEVQDTGPGIKLEDQGNLFKRFAQGEVGKRYSGGTGLGLHLCKQLVEAHAGTIECESRVNEITTFRVKLPRTGRIHPHDDSRRTH